MNLEKIFLIIALLVAIVGAFTPIPYAILILLIGGIVSGATNPLNEISDRTGYLIFAGVGPMVAGQLDAIPFIGSYVGAIIVSITLFAAGIWLSSIILSLVKRVMP